MSVTESASKSEMSAKSNLESVISEVSHDAVRPCRCFAAARSVYHSSTAVRMLPTMRCPQRDDGRSSSFVLYPSLSTGASGGGERGGVGYLRVKPHLRQGHLCVERQPRPAQLLVLLAVLGGAAAVASG